MMDRMTAENESEASDLVGDLLEQCSLDNIPPFYRTKIEEAGGILPAKLMYYYHPRFTLETIHEDLPTLADVVLIAPPAAARVHLPVKGRFKNQKEFLLTARGLLKCVKKLVAAQSSGQVTRAQLHALLGLAETERPKVDALLGREKFHGRWKFEPGDIGALEADTGEAGTGASDGGYILTRESYWQNPAKRRLLIEIVCLAILGVVVISVLATIVSQFEVIP